MILFQATDLPHAISNAVQHSWNHWGDLLDGAIGLSILAHMVNTFPVPKNLYGQWLLGSVQFAVGQRVRASNTFKGEDTTAVSTGPTAGIGSKPNEVVAALIQAGDKDGKTDGKSS